MEKAFTSIFIHVIVSVKNRKSMIPKENLGEVFDYIMGTVRRKGQNPIVISGYSDHIHLFLGMKPGTALSTFVRDVKTNVSHFINLQDWMREKFTWQNGFGAFSYGRSQVEQVEAYLKNQSEFHRSRSFREEYVAILQKSGISYDEKGLPPDLE